jgi:hypothetical protein
MTQRVLNLQNEKCKYLILNIIAHDVIHDYGNADSDRWPPVQKVLQDFYDTTTTGGNPTKRQRASQTYVITQQFQKKDASQKKEDFPGKSYIIGLQKDRFDEYNIEPVLNKFIDDIHNEIIMAFFHIYISSRIKSKEDGVIEKSIKNSRKTIRTRTTVFRKTQKSRSRSRSRSRSSRERNYHYQVLDYIEFIEYVPFILENKESSINYIYSDISNLFYAFLKNGLGNQTMEYYVKTEKDLEQLLKFLYKFFKDENEYVKIVIYSYAFNRKKRSRSSSFHGGAKPKDKMSGEDAVKLFDAVKDSIIPGTPIHNTIEEMANLYKNVLENDLGNNQSRVNEGRIDYNKKRQQIIENLTEIYNANSGEKYANSLEKINIIGQKIPRKYNVSEHIYRTINESIEAPRKIAEKKIKEDSDRMSKIADDIRKAQSGKLTSEDKTLVGNFMKFIAKMGLLVTGCINYDHTTNADNTINYNNTINLSNDKTLNMEIDALLYVAKIQGGSTRNKDIDNTLIDYYDLYVNSTPKYAYKDGEYMNDQRLQCGRDSKKYVINNAAPIGSLIKSAFCPYTSIIDGMPSCSWKSSQRDGIEYGDMDFKITENASNPLYYNGTMKIGDDISRIDVGFDINFPGFGKVNGKKLFVDMKTSDDLEASVVLRNTLLSILLSIPNLRLTNIWDGIYARLTEQIPDPQDATNTKTIPLFSLIYKEILFKGVGDLFQEANAAFKYGGYTMENYTCDPDIYSYQETDGNQIRGFLAKDRPSGTRFIFMLLNGSDAEINKKAFGGYYSNEKEILAKRSDNKNICKN